MDVRVSNRNVDAVVFSRCFGDVKSFYKLDRPMAPSLLGTGERDLGFRSLRQRSHCS